MTLDKKDANWIPDAEPLAQDQAEAQKVRDWIATHPKPWQLRASAGMPGSFVAANGVRHIRSFPCPDSEKWNAAGEYYGPRYYLTADAHMWCEDWPEGWARGAAR